MTEAVHALSVVIPAHNEAGNLAPLVEELHHALAGREVEILLVDDGSTDSTLAEMKRLENKVQSKVRVLQLTPRQGKQAALVVGFEAARHDWVLCLDADGQDDPAYVKTMLETQVRERADAVVGVRHRAEPRFRSWMQALFAWLVALRFSVHLHDVNSPFRLVRTRLVQGRDWRQGEFRFLPAIWAMQGARVAETPVQQRPRGHGQSKFLGLWRYVEALFILWTLPGAKASTSRPWLRFALQAGVSISLLLFLALFLKQTELRQAFSQTAFLPIVGLGIVNFLAMAIKSERWRGVLSAWGIAYPRFRALRAYLVAAFLGMVTPLKLGHFSRGAMLVRDAQVPVSTAMTSVVLDRLLDVLLLSVLTLPLIDRLLGISPLYATALAVIVWVLFLLLSTLVRVHPIHGISFRMDTSTGQDRALLVSSSLFPVLLWTCLGYAVFFSLAWLLSQSVGLNVSFWELVPALALVNLLSVVPITVAGIGTRELALVILLQPLGVSAESATIFGMAYFLCFYASSALFGAVALVVDLPHEATTERKAG